MDTAATNRSRWRHGLLRRLPYLCCLSFVIYEVFAFGLRAVYFVSSPALPTMEGCQLDSFSQPSVASAILKQESQRLMASYAQRRQISIRDVGPQQRQPGDKLVIERFEELQREVCNMDGELDGELMVIYYDKQRWNQFLDRYLHFIHSNPQSPNVLTWAWPALTSSQQCSRTEELYSELGNLARFHPSLKTAAGLTNVLAEWTLSKKGSAREPVAQSKPDLKPKSIEQLEFSRP